MAPRKRSCEMPRTRGSALKIPRRKLVIAVAVSAILLSACGGGRAELGTGVTPCYEALPVAQKAAPTSSFFIGVKLISQNSASKILLTKLPASPGSVCVVAYKLHHGNSSPSHHGARFDLIAISPKTKKILVNKELNRLPIAFRRNLSL